MEKRTRLITGLATSLVLVGSLIVATPAAATTDRASIQLRQATLLNSEIVNGQRELASLSAREQALLTEFGTVSTVEYSTSTTVVSASDYRVASAAAVLGESSKAAIVCKTKKHSRTAYSLANIALYMSYHTGGYCTNGSTVVSASWVDGGGQTYWAGWSNLGLINKGAGMVAGQGRSFSQQSFQFQLGTPWPTQYTQPCLRVRGISNLVVAVDSVCGLY